MTEWTLEERKLITDHYLAGRSPEWIADEMESTKGAIKMALSRWGVRRGPAPGLERAGRPRRPEERDDLATRLRILLGLEARPPSERRLFSDPELLAFAGRGLSADPEGLRDRVASFLVSPPADWDGTAWSRLRGLDAFARDVLGLELMDHQLAMAYACLASKRAICLAGRQCGKDVTQAALALWESVTATGARIVVVSGAQRQSDALTEKVLGFVARDDKLFDSVLRSSREALEFTNGSFIKPLPATGVIRGETATRVLVNEARDILDEEETYAAVEPMLLVTAGSLGIFSTPLGKSGRLWEAFSSPLYLKTRIPSRASRYAAPEHLERQRLEMSAARFANEYEAEFLDVQSSFFSAESIARCAREYDVAMVREEGLTYALGIDWARTRDTSAMVVVSRDEEDHLRVAYLRGFLGVPMPDQVAFVRHLHATFAFRRIVSEFAGLGVGPTDQLVRELGVHVVDAFTPTSERKALAYDALKQRFETGRLAIPMDPRLLAELRTLEFKLSSGGTLMIHHPGGGSDDFADALAFACWPFRRKPDGPGAMRWRLPWSAGPNPFEPRGPDASGPTATPISGS